MVDFHEISAIRNFTLMFRWKWDILTDTQHLTVHKHYKYFGVIVAYSTICCNLDDYVAYIIKYKSTVCKIY